MIELLQRATESIPQAASSPYSLVAYLAVLACWLIVAMRVTRNAQLLKKIEALPEADRLAAIQAEMGAAVPPTLTAEQWLRSRTQSYLFIGSIVLVCSAVLVGIVAITIASTKRTQRIDAAIGLAQPTSILNQLAPPPGEDKPPIQIGQAPPPGEESRRGSEEDLAVTYHANATPSREIISYDIPYADMLRAGKRVRGYGSWYEPFKWDFPRLSVQVSNNLDRTVLLTEARFRIASSKADDMPLLLIHENPYNVGGIYFLNDGWGDAKDAKLTIEGWEEGSYPSGYGPNDCSATMISWLGRSSVTLDAGTITTGKNVDISQNVPTHFRAADSVCVAGTLTYTHAKGRDALRFLTAVSLRAPGPGAPAPPSATYDLMLQSDKAPYEADVPISQSLISGGADNFSFRTRSDKSATYEIEPSFATTEGLTIRAQPVTLSIFIPRTDANRGSLDIKWYYPLSQRQIAGLPHRELIRSVRYNPYDKSDLAVMYNLPNLRLSESITDGVVKGLATVLKNSSFPNVIFVASYDSGGQCIATSGEVDIR